MRRLLALAAAVVLCGAPLSVAGVAEATTTARVSGPATAQINGTGSTWAENALNIWIHNVQDSEGLQIGFTGSGSAQGRTDFRNYTNDFAVSDIGYQGSDPVTGTNDTACQNTDTKPPSKCRPYVYLPIVAGGTSFPYQVRVAGQLVESLRLSGETLAKIFTNKITNWDDPEIAADNHHKFWIGYGSHAQIVTSLPNLTITPVVDSEGSGASAQFTRYLTTLYPSIWNPYAGAAGMTEYFPRQGNEKAEPGSDGIINYVTSAAGDGAIGYDEYSYALNDQCSGCGPYGWPVALLENHAGYFTAPNQYNVAVALTKAQINMDQSSPDYLLQNLNGVYTNPDKRTYAMSSYSYMIIPTSPTDQTMSTPKRQTLAEFIDWDVCGGQSEMGSNGYSPLPVNLAQASFAQMYKLHTADKSVQIANLNVATKCANPTFWAGHSENINFLAQIAPDPPSCDSSSQAPCEPGAGIGPIGNPTHGKPPTTPSTSPTSSSSANPSGSATPSSGTSSGSTGNGSTGNGTTGTGSTGDGSNGSTGTGNPIGSPTSLAASESSGDGELLAILAAVEVLLLLVIPPIIVRRRQSQGLGRGSGRGSDQ